ncbi:MAG: GAF domain-containing protein [Aggregatilineales bacterium]
MTAWLQNLLAQAEIQESDPLAQLRQRFLRGAAGATTLAALGGTLAQLAIRPTVPAMLTSASVFVVSIALLVLTQQRRLRIAALLLLATLIAATFAASALRYAFLLYLLLGTLALFSAATLLPRWPFILTNTVIFARGFALLGAAAAGAPPEAPEEFLIETVTSAALILSTLLIVSAFSRYTVEQLRGAVQQTQRAADQLAATAQVAQITAATLDLTELFNRSVELIRDYFGFYHVQVFMVDARGEFATLAASTGDVGQQLLARRHQLPVGSASVIGRVTYFGQPVIAADTDLDPLHRPNDLLPNTRSEMAVPIFDGERVIGALDAQSTEPRAFTPLDVQVLQTLADLLAVAIRNARLFEEKTRALAEQERLVQQADVNLREIQRLNQQLTRASWSQFLEHRPDTAGVTLRDGVVRAEAEWSQPLITAARTAQPVASSAGPVAVPVMLRGEVIGAIEVEPGNLLPAADVVAVLEAVAQRLAFSLENARLFEEANLAATQEQRINAIATQYQSVSSVDDLLRVTLTELSEMLGARRGAIRLGSVGSTNGDTAR